MPSGKVIEDPTMGPRLDKEVVEQQGSLLTEQGNQLVMWHQHIIINRSSI